MTDDLFRRPTRREFLTVGTGIFLVLSLPRALRRRPQVSRRTIPLMGTIAEIQVAHPDERVAQAGLDAGIAELQWVERTMTRFDPRSDIGRVNLGGARDGVRVSAETGLVIERALLWASVTDGRFDPAIGEASELWDVLHRRVPPPERQVRRLAGRGFWRKVDLTRDAAGARVRLNDRDVHVDLGGIAKGYGIDRAVAAIRRLGIAHAIVTVGGDLYALGHAPDGAPWEVGIRDPHHLDQLAGRLEVSDRAVTTSGDYERFFEYHGVRYHHLIDPVTAAPRRTGMHSATVVGANCFNADAASTAAFGLDRDIAQRMVRRVLGDAEVIPLT
ncbi:MAG TPA: FAD:protein FMN transferase [Gemmatimonadales bacterium]|nr:FAD:protein FMN transferase [Gemmatimonadales bacterium]